MANKFTDAVFHAKLPALDKAVLWAIAHRTDNETGACHPSLKTVSKEGGACTTIVKQVIAYAVEIGLLECTARRDGNINLANEYVFRLPALRWLERADSRFVPDGETDQGARANLGKLLPQVGKQPMAGLVHGPRVYKRPPKVWGGKRLKNSEVDLVLRSRHSNSDSTQKKTQRKTGQTDQEPPLHPNGQPELHAMMAASPKLLHDKSCPCYPCRAGILCFCGLYEMLLEQLGGCYDCACMDPHPDTNGDSAELYGVSCRVCGGFVQWPNDDDKLGTWIGRTVPGPADVTPVRPFEMEG